MVSFMTIRKTAPGKTDEGRFRTRRLHLVRKRSEQGFFCKHNFALVCTVILIYFAGRKWIGPLDDPPSLPEWVGNNYDPFRWGCTGHVATWMNPNNASWCLLLKGLNIYIVCPLMAFYNTSTEAEDIKSSKEKCWCKPERQSPCDYMYIRIV